MIDVDTLNKDQLAEYALATFNAELNMRKSLDTLRGEVKTMQSPVKPESLEIPASATHLLNRDNGKIFAYTEALAKHLKNAVRCDERGNLV